MNTVLLTILHSKTCIFIENDFDVSLFYSISYLLINKSVHMLYIYSHYLMKLHEFFFFLQAYAGIFFSCSISCMTFFFGSDTPPPRISNGPPLTRYFATLYFIISFTVFGVFTTQDVV